MSENEDILIEQEVRRWSEGYEFLLLVARTFSALNLWQRESICDTLLSLVCTFLNVRHGGVLLARDAELSAAALRDLTDADILQDPRALAFFRRQLEEKAACVITPAQLVAAWPGAPESLRHGELVIVAIDIQDVAVGVLFVANKVTDEPFGFQDIAFLRGAAGIAAMALTTADAMTAQRHLSNELERKAEEARREATERAQAVSQLADKLRIIEEQRFAILELSTPVLQVWDDIIALPIIGIVDTRRAADIMERLLTEIQTRQSRYVILDITGVEVVDTKTADHFIKVVKAAELLGARCLLTGIRPAVAQTLVEIGVDLSSVTTERNLKEALRGCLRIRRQEQEQQKRVG